MPGKLLNPRDPRRVTTLKNSPAHLMSTTRDKVGKPNSSCMKVDLLLSAAPERNPANTGSHNSELVFCPLSEYVLTFLGMHTQTGLA